ncbi:DUF2922 domain-containing protein [Mammaliicoccus stepanovicii]|uniref:Protein of uncharacterized function (DUF2922) n=1 Tax=Mammaliicoccus stepanovicii TaxID=643214 RepID=A0A239YED7_9STAP|nr:DUF2922 domain-containing protein [Mammaliicoccus stepanovicii]PNZ75828.1 DUF2922 domain-containing protein [Mammaliicoccus stepanovicii]GGI42707.1 hypothetical protein GCM10010896_19760 [Mammaliicoccus stepanovicii]SNV57082.1 Protein of uncharacterised function (DUF2922) [Mammaliicoccus stepanovicii]
MKRILELVFKTATDKTFTLQIQEPKNDLSEETVRQAMNDLLKLKIFDLSKGELVSIHSAQYVERNTHFIVK